MKSYLERYEKRDTPLVKKYWRWPNPARGEFSRPFGGIVEVLRHYSRLLPVFGWLEVSEEKDADLVVGHLGTESERLDVFHLHGLYPTGEIDCAKGNWIANGVIINNILRAGRIIAVSQWVADILRRDLHLDPWVVGHGFDWDVWRAIPIAEKGSQPMVLWNKTRNWGVCDPTPVIEVAKRLPQMDFVTTFLPRNIEKSDVPSNVHVTGLLNRWDAWQLVKACDIYLGTTKETFGVNTLEAMASKAVVVGYKWGCTPELVTDCGLLVHPGDYDGLTEAVREALERKEELGDKGYWRVQSSYGWLQVAERLAGYYHSVVDKPERTTPLVSVVLPCWNKEKYVAAAIESVCRQTFTDWELLIVDDASTDASRTIIEQVIDGKSQARLLVHEENKGVAHARNYAISEAKGEYICCLDADDAIHQTYLANVVPALEADRRLAIAYTGLRVMNEEGELRSKKHGFPQQYDPKRGLRGNQIPTCCVFRREWWERVGGQRQRYAPHGAGQEDADFWLRILLNGGQARMVTDKPLFHYRFSEEQVTRIHRNDWKRDLYHQWFPCTKDDGHPFASQAGVPPQHSWPVRNYDCPLISVIVPVGVGHEEYLIDALDSIEAQTFRYWEMIVVNDTGHDLNLSPWPFAKVLKTDGGVGPGYARNYGTTVASAKFVVYLDADDYLHRDFLEYTYGAHKGGKEWIYTDFTALENGKFTDCPLKDWDLERLYNKPAAGVTCLYPRQAWEDVKGFDHELLHEDWDFHIRLALAGYCGVHLPQQLFVYRKHTGTRRKAGREKRAKYTEIHALYTKEQIMGCGCGGRRRAIAHPLTRREQLAATRPVARVAHKKEWVPMRYTGKSTGMLTLRGRQGRRYTFSDTDDRRVQPVHPHDVPNFARKSFLQIVGQA